LIPRKRTFKWVVMPLLVALLFGAPAPALAEDPEKVAILPFQIYSEKDLSFLRKGIVDMLASRLAQTGKVTVISRQETEQALVDVDGPLDDAQARSIGLTLGADYILYGSLTVFGASVSIDAKMVDVAGGREPVAVFTQSEMEQVIAKINQFALEINSKVFGHGVVAVTPAPPMEKPAPTEAPTPQETTPEIYAHPEKMIQSGFGGRDEESMASSSAFFDLKTTSGGLYKFWKSRNFDIPFTGLAIGDVDGDGKQETVISGNKQVLIYRQEKDRFFEVGAIDKLGGRAVMGVDVADINGNGIDEIFISSANKRHESVSSVVYEYNGSNYVKISDGGFYFFRVMHIKDRGNVLFGQRQSPGNMPPPLRPIYELSWGAGELKEVNQVVPSNRGTILGAGIGDVMSDKEKVALIYDRTDRLVMYSSDGKEIWNSGEFLGGSTLFFRMPAREVGDENRYYLPMRVVVRDLDGNGQDEVILAENHEMAGRRLQTFRSFNRSNIQIRQWDGLGLANAFKTRKMSGAVRDLAVGDFDNDGKNELIAAILQKEGTTVGVKPKSSVIAFDLKR